MIEEVLALLAFEDSAAASLGFAAGRAMKIAITRRTSVSRIITGAIEFIVITIGVCIAVCILRSLVFSIMAVGVAVLFSVTAGYFFAAVLTGVALAFVFICLGLIFISFLARFATLFVCIFTRIFGFVRVLVYFCLVFIRILVILITFVGVLFLPGLFLFILTVCIAVILFVFSVSVTIALVVKTRLALLTFRRFAFVHGAIAANVLVAVRVSATGA